MITLVITLVITLLTLVVVVKVCQSAALAQQWVRPYVQRVDNLCDLCSLYLLLITFFSAVLDITNHNSYAWLLLLSHLSFVAFMLLRAARE